MRDAIPSLVLDSEVLSRNAMGEPTPSHSSSPNPGIPAEPCVSDEQLMLALSKGSAGSFSELFARYKQPIFGFFRRRVFEPAHAEELTQETFLALFRSAARYQPRALFRTYLYAISFKILRAYRRKAAFRATFFGQRTSIPEPGKHDATESALWVRHAVEKLDPIDREILLLREFEQLSYAGIADLLELPLNTVRSRLFRARMALRDLLEPSAKGALQPAAQSAPQNLAQKGERA